MFSTLKQDLPASVVVFFVAVPLCLGIALASGAPLFAGLIAGIIGGVVVGALSGSPLGVSGPAAGLAVIVLTAINDLGSFEALLLCTVIAGAVQILLGLAKAGVLAYFFPTSVIKGMLSGIGLLIVLKQIPHAFGHDTDYEGDLGFQQPDGETTFSSLNAMLGDLSPSATVVSMTCLALLILWDVVLKKRGRLFEVVPGPLAAVVFGITYQLVTSRVAPEWALSGDHLVSVPVPESLAALQSLIVAPDWGRIVEPEIWVTSITIAVVASIETLLCVEATDKLDPQKRVTPTNRELIAQGVGNIASGSIGGLPITQVIVRSSANIQSGGKSKLAAVLHGAFLLLFVLVLPQVLNLIPLAALAAILFVVGYKLAKPALFKQMWALGLSQFLPFVVTIVAILLTDLLTGIGLGMAVAIFALLRANYLNSHFLHIEEGDTEAGQHVVVLHLSEEVTFLNKGAIVREFAEIPDGSKVTIDMSRSVLIDQDVLEVISDFETSAKTRDIEVVKVTDAPVTTPRLVKLAERRERFSPA